MFAILVTTKFRKRLIGVFVSQAEASQYLKGKGFVFESAFDAWHYAHYSAMIFALESPDQNPLPLISRG